MVGPALHGLDDGPHVFNAGVVGATDPDRVDLRGGHHRANRGVGLGVANSILSSQRGGFRRVVAVRASDALHVGPADALPRIDVKAGDEAAPDEPNAESLIVGHGRTRTMWKR